MRTRSALGSIVSNYLEGVLKKKDLPRINNLINEFTRDVDGFWREDS